MNGPDRTFDDLMRIINDVAVTNSDENNEIRAKAVEALGKLGDTRAITPLLVLLEDEDEDSEVRANAAFALGELHAVRAIEPLIKIVEGVIYHNANEGIVTQSAIWSLASLRAFHTIPLLIDACDHEDVDIQKAARSTLVKFGARAVTPLIETLTKGQARFPVFLISALGRIGDVRAMDSLYHVLDNKYAHRYERSEAAEALGKVGREKASELLTQIYLDMSEDIDVRRHAIIGLGFTHDPKVFSLLLEASKNENRRIRMGAATALGVHGDPRAVAPLMTLLDDEDYSVHLTAAEALERVRKGQS